MMGGARHQSDEEQGRSSRSGSRGTPREEDMDTEMENEGYYGLQQPTGGARLV